jgi:protein involved in polysaccharide export with SLBB domain
MYSHSNRRPLARRRQPGIRPWLPAAGLLCLAFTGCAALTNPVAEGIPVRRLPPEVLFGDLKDPKVALPLTMLGQPEPEAYRLGPGDILGIFIEGALGERNAPPPPHWPDSPVIKPALGYPVSVGEDGNLSLPLVPPIQVGGMTLPQAEEAIRRAYTVTRKILQPGRDRMLITLQRRRTYHVLVMRQEAGGFDTTPEAIAGVALATATTKQGNGHVLELPAYQNDILEALSRTGGLPGLDCYDTVFVFRHPSRADLAQIQAQLGRPVTADKPNTLPAVGCPVQVIPLRVRPGDLPPLTVQDVILNTGDVVFLEARPLDVFYTGGLLPPGEFVLPRDRDLDVVEAVSFVRGPLVNGAFSGSNLAGPLLAPGIGFPNPSLLTVIRRLPEGGEIRIRVDLNKALRYPQERVVVKPKDKLILSQTPEEAVAQYISGVLRLGISYQHVPNVGTISTVNTTLP